MSKKLNLEGQKFGRWTVLSEEGKDRHGKVLWFCRCTCGVGKTVTGNGLRTGNTTSCGCYKKDLARYRVKTHGQAHTSMYNIWSEMKQRCHNVKCKSYENYGP